MPSPSTGGAPRREKPARRPARRAPSRRQSQSQSLPRRNPHSSPQRSEQSGMLERQPLLLRPNETPVASHRADCDAAVAQRDRARHRPRRQALRDNRRLLRHAPAPPSRCPGQNLHATETVPVNWKITWQTNPLPRSTEAASPHRHYRAQGGVCASLTPFAIRRIPAPRRRPRPPPQRSLLCEHQAQHTR
jgi:hypothetical protein